MKAGYSEAYAKTQATKILENHSVKAYVDNQLSILKKDNIARADEVLQIFTAILRQEMSEEVTQLNPLTGEFVTIEKKPSIAEVIKAGTELMKRYPTSIELKKLNLEIEKLKSQVGGDDNQDDKIATFLNMIKEEVANESN